MSSPSTQPQWKQLLTNARKHYGRLSTQLWRLTKTLVQLYDDEEFRVECRGLKQEPHEWIDAEFPHLPFRFIELKAILEAYPNEQDWKNNKLSVLADAIPPAKKETADRQKPRRISVAEYEALEKERDHYKFRADFLDGRVKELEQSLEQSNATIQRLEGRLEELEKLQPSA